MFDDPRLLVVDDEEVICQGCRRIFSPQGYRVETSSNPCEGLSLAAHNDYIAILLDIRMPTMDGIQFLEELRKRKPDAPVILITGYPSVSNAASAMRLGASDYVTKPFTPEDITRAVQRMAGRGANANTKSGVAQAKIDQWTPATEEFRFWDESWLLPETDGTVRVGAMLTPSQGAFVDAIHLPRIGEVVYQGLPLAGLTGIGVSQFAVPSPVSGIIVAVNTLLADYPSGLWNDPCGKGWIACISPTRYEQEVGNCKPRRIILANADETSAHDQHKRLTALGCQVSIVCSQEELMQAIQDTESHVAVIDAASFAEKGPGLAQQINDKDPSIKIVVVASPLSSREISYRARKIFYYAIEPFVDNEITDVLDAAFQRQERLPVQEEHHDASSRAVSKIIITNRNGKKVCLLAAKDLLREGTGLGWHLKRQLLAQHYPVDIILGDADITPVKVLHEASTCDRLLVLLRKDTSHLPGTVIHDTKGEFIVLTDGDASKVETLVVQPGACGDADLKFDTRTTVSLAKHIIREMTSF